MTFKRIVIAIAVIATLIAGYYLLNWTVVIY
jgi:hypothetical protein